MGRPSALMMPAATSSGLAGSVALQTPGPVVIVGANGSGKTRLGTWFEFSNGQQSSIHRVAAQRSLVFPNTISSLSTADAAFGLKYGLDVQHYNEETFSTQRVNIARQGEQQFIRENKWQREPETSLQNDYPRLLTYLFSEQNEINLAFAQRARGGVVGTPPDTKIERIKRIWEQVLPHRQLLIQTNTISVQSVGPLVHSGAYKASSMSDGERVAFYLIGQCLTAPVDSIIVADEPEVHLHRAIQLRLWNAIEQARPDCLFVYLTHDLDFAASRTNAKKLWIKEYTGSAWDWREVANTEGIPEDLLLTVLGSRAPVLFTEGHPGGYEQAIFSRIYPTWTVMPCGNCEQVIEATKSFSSLRHLHGNQCFGIIDRDYRTDHDAVRLQTQGVYVLPTQEVENLMLDEAVLVAILEHAISTGALAGTVPEKLTAIKAYLFEQLARDQELLSTKWASWEIEKTLRKFGTAEGERGLAALQQAIATTAALSVEEIYQRIDQEFTRIIAEQDYPALLRLYNNKGLAKRIGHFFNLREPFPDYFERLLSIQNNDALVQALRRTTPELIIQTGPGLVITSATQPTPSLTFVSVTGS